MRPTAYIPIAAYGDVPYLQRPTLHRRGSESPVGKRVGYFQHFIVINRVAMNIHLQIINELWSSLWKT